MYFGPPTLAVPPSVPVLGVCPLSPLNNFTVTFLAWFGIVGRTAMGYLPKPDLRDGRVRARLTFCKGWMRYIS